VSPRLLLDDADRSLERREGFSLEAERQRDVEHDLGVGRAVRLGEQLRRDPEHELSPQQVEGDVAVVHEEPAAAPERVAVGLLHRRADGSP